MRVIFQNLLIQLLLFAFTGILRAQGFNPSNPPEPMTQRMVRIIAEPAEGVYSITTGGYHSVGQSITISVSTNSTYHFSHWTLNGAVYSHNASFQYVVGDSIASFVAVLEKNPTIYVSVSPAAAGYASGGGTFSIGYSRRISTSANSGYTFLYWTLNGEYYSNASSFYYTTTNADADFVAVYHDDSIVPEHPFDPSDPAEPMANKSISVQTNLPDSIQPKSITKSGYYAYGASVSISVTPPDGYSFLYWTRNGTQYSESTSFNYVVGLDNEVFVAHFAAKQIVSVTCSPEGAATVSGGGYYNTNTRILLSTTPNAGYKFVCWKLNEMRYSEVPDFYYYVGSRNVSFVAEYEVDDSFDPNNPGGGNPFSPSNPGEPQTDSVALVISVMANDASLGSVSGLPNKPLFAGDVITLTATPSCDGYYFARWADGNTSNPLTITLSGDDVYMAFFAKRQYRISFYDEGGTVLLNQRQWDYGDIPSCVSPAKPDDELFSYRFSGWQPALVSVAQAASYVATYEAIPLNPLSLGDVNADGVVNVMDATALIGAYLKGTTDSLQQSVADVNHDGVINVMDATEIINIYLHNR